jgi:hypothetical protein
MTRQCPISANKIMGDDGTLNRLKCFAVADMSNLLIVSSLPHHAPFFDLSPALSKGEGDGPTLANWKS